MDNSKKYFRTGIFTVITVIALAGMLLFLGVADSFEERLHFVTTFEESVQGLTTGAAVKYKGVPIGAVDRIVIQPQGRVIRVDMSIDPKVFQEFNSISNDAVRLKKIREFFDASKKVGLSCKLDLAGVTGMRYIEMDIVPENKRRKNPLPEINEPGVFYFPSVPGVFNNIIDSMATSLEKISKVDTPKLGEDLTETVASLRAILQDPALRDIIEQLKKTSIHVEKISATFSENMTDVELKSLIKKVSDNLDSLNELTNQLNSKLENIDAQKLNSHVVATLTSGQKLMEDLQKDSKDAARSIREFSSVLRNLNELLDEVKQDPSSLIRGRDAKPVDFDK